MFEFIHCEPDVYNDLINTEILYEELEGMITDFSSPVIISKGIKKLNCHIASVCNTRSARPQKIAKILRFMIDHELMNRIKEYAAEMEFEITDANTRNENCLDIQYPVGKVSVRSLFKFIYYENIEFLKYFSEEGLFDLIEDDLKKILIQFDRFVVNAREKYFIVRTGYNRGYSRYVCLVKSFYEEKGVAPSGLCSQYSSYYYQQFYKPIYALFDKFARYLNIECQIKQ